MEHLTHRLARFMVGGALTVAIIFAAAHGLEKGATWYIKIALVIGLVCVAIGEFLSWHNAATAWHERRGGSLALWALLGVLLSVGVFYTNFASSAGNNEGKASVQKAAYVTYVDADKTELDLTKAVTRIEERLRIAPVRTAEAARAAQDNAKAHKWWVTTKQCTETKGPQTREFCSAYASAVADESMATEAKVLTEELKTKRSELAELRKARASAPAVVSDDQAAVVTLASMLSIDTKSARQIDSMTLPVLVQAMLLLGGILLANEAFRGKARRPWGIVAFIRSLWSGKATTGPSMSEKFRSTYDKVCEAKGLNNPVSA